MIFCVDTTRTQTTGRGRIELPIEPVGQSVLHYAGATRSGGHASPPYNSMADTCRRLRISSDKIG